MLSELGYDGLFKQKTRESMGQYGKVDGCAIFWRKSKFSLTENYSLEFNEIVKRNADQLGLEDSDKHRSDSNALLVLTLGADISVASPKIMLLKLWFWRPWLDHHSSSLRDLELAIVSVL